MDEREDIIYGLVQMAGTRYNKMSIMNNNWYC